MKYVAFTRLHLSYLVTDIQLNLAFSKNHRFIVKSDGDNFHLTFAVVDRQAYINMTLLFVV